MGNLSTFLRANKALITLALIGLLIGSASARLTASFWNPFSWGEQEVTTSTNVPVAAQESSASASSHAAAAVEEESGWFTNFFEAVTSVFTGGEPDPVEVEPDFVDWNGQMTEDVLSHPFIVPDYYLFDVPGDGYDMNEFLENAVFNDADQSGTYDEALQDGFITPQEYQEIVEEEDKDGTVYTSAELESCSNEEDEDGDGNVSTMANVDMNDSDCQGDDAIGEILNCGDTRDNDNDTLRDSFDPDCAEGGSGEIQIHSAGLPPNCDDRVDNDRDGPQDIHDSDCEDGGRGEIPPSAF